MSFSRWLRNRTIASTARRSPPVRHRCRPRLEPLEGRLCPSYTVVDLGEATWPAALNESGQLVGMRGGSAFLWQNGVTTDLGTLGHDSSNAHDINDAGQVVGAAGGQLFYGDEIPPAHAFLWQNGVMTDIGGPHSTALAINAAGQIAGYGTTAGVHGAVVWEAGVMYNLNALAPAGAAMTLSSGQDINDQGQIVGMGYVNGVAHHFLFTDDDGIFANGGAVLTDLGTIDAYEPARINNAGQVLAGRYLYANGTATYIGFNGRGINDAGQVVGAGFLWQNGQTTNLNTLVAPSAGWALSLPAAINELGEVAGVGEVGGQFRGFLMTESAGLTLSIDDAVVTEGDTGTVNASFTVTLSAASTETVAVNYATANYTAVAGSDYQAVSGVLTFNPGETSKTVTVPVYGDTLDEYNETFFVNLTGPTNALLSKSVGRGTILDDDPPLALAVNDVAATEGHSGTTNFVFTVSLSAASGQAVTVRYATANGTAVAGSDYVATSGTLTFAPGETAKSVTIRGNGDRVGELNETFVVNLSAPTNATIADAQGGGAIMDDEPRISINDVTRAEGRQGQTTLFTFTVTLSAAYDQAVTMSFRTVNGTATTGNGDYIAKTGTLTFNPGETTKTITITVKGDNKREADEVFYLDLFGNSSNSLFAKNRGIGTILNDD